MTKGALTLRKFREYYVHNKFFDHNLTVNNKNLADFKDLIPQIDSWLYWWYRNELVATDELHEQGISSEFIAYIIDWWIARVPDFNKVYNAMVAKYDPLSNYDMIEHEGEARDRNNIINSEEHEGDITNKTQPRATENYESTNLDPDANDRKFDSSSWTKGIGTDGKINNSAIEDTTEDGRTITTTNGFDSEAQAKETGAIVEDDNTSKLSGNDISERLLTRKGNIGVTTSQDMLQAELELRKQSFVKYFGECFEHECLTGLYDYNDDYYRW